MKRFILLSSVMVFTIIAISSGCMGVKQEAILIPDLGQGPIVSRQPSDVVEALSHINRVFIYPDPNNKARGTKDILVYPEVVLLKSGEKNSVTWEKVGFEDSEEPGFEIIFEDDDFPFKKKKYDNSNSNSGKPKKDLEFERKNCRVKCYKYTVRVTNYEDLDPAVIIWR